MQCSLCGTDVKQGFFVCTGCGAHAGRPAIALGRIITIVGSFLLFVGFVVNEPKIGIVIGGSILVAGLLLTKLLKRVSPLVWMRRI